MGIVYLPIFYHKKSTLHVGKYTIPIKSYMGYDVGKIMRKKSKNPFARRGATAATTASFVTFAIRVKRSDERRRATGTFDDSMRHLEDELPGIVSG